ncbi:hypothetical protein GCM10007989_20720 [Devosia pacifica]|uniref:Uncharacterized protein n=1 Tax=Devosia pacifica TaxID=1335967 RepID=A0A918VSC3_9HYPH|nr:hypothetical protein GCM10007989_20720 [Devosia pacifica]
MTVFEQQCCPAGIGHPHGPVQPLYELAAGFGRHFGAAQPTQSECMSAVFIIPVKRAD